MFNQCKSQSKVFLSVYIGRVWQLTQGIWKKFGGLPLQLDIKRIINSNTIISADGDVTNEAPLSMYKKMTAILKEVPLFTRGGNLHRLHGHVISK